MRKAAFLLGVSILLGGCALEGEELFEDDVTFGDDQSAVDADASSSDGAESVQTGHIDASSDHKIAESCWGMQGDVTCEGLGFYGDVLLTIEDVHSGDYHVNGEVVAVSTDTNYLDFASTIGMRAVIVRGGSTAMVCTYDVDQFVVTGLHAPIGAPITAVSFCAPD